MAKARAFEIYMVKIRNRAQYWWPDVSYSRNYTIFSFRILKSNAGLYFDRASSMLSTDFVEQRLCSKYSYPRSAHLGKAVSAYLVIAGVVHPGMAAIDGSAYLEIGDLEYVAIGVSA